MRNDFDFYFALKSEDFNIFWVGAETYPDKNRLKTFFYNAVDNAEKPDTRKIYIIENEEGSKVGHLYIIPEGNSFELATAILEKYCGKGYGRRAIELGFEEGKRLGFQKMITKIREDNVASMKAYMSCGVKKRDDFAMVYIPKLAREVRMYYMEYNY